MARALRLLALQRFRGDDGDGLYGSAVHGDGGAESDLHQHFADPAIVAAVARFVEAEEARVAGAINLELGDHLVGPHPGRDWQREDGERHDCGRVDGSVAPSCAGTVRRTAPRSYA